MQRSARTRSRSTTPALTSLAPARNTARRSSHAIARKIQKAKTDAEPLPSEEQGLAPRPEADNLVGIFAAMSGTTKAEVLGQYGGNQFSTFKKALAELAVAKISPITAEMRRLTADPAEIDRILADGSRRAATISEPIMHKVKDIVGFIRS